MRKRVKENFPTVLLTLLSIVQALALELLWSHLHETGYLYDLTMISIISWLQILASFLGLVLIWVVYASNVMRFRWLPVTSDSVYPFLIGLVEFMLIEALGVDAVGLWLVIMALIFAMMVWVSHTTMRRARQDGDNDEFFKNLAPAEFRDFYPQFATVSALALAGIYLMFNNDSTILALVAVLGTFCLLVWQFYVAAKFWKLSLAD